MIYLDNSATSFPKAPGVTAAMTDYLDRLGTNINRATYLAATETALVVEDLRADLCEFFNNDSETGCFFTPGATYGINQILRGYLNPGDHVLVSSLEHNAVMRPLHDLSQTGVRWERVPCAADGSLDPHDLKRRLRPETRLVMMIHASNVSGTILPLSEVGAICAEAEIPLVVDAAQSAGHLPLDMQAQHLAGLVAPGHKGLLGPQGIGVMLLRRDFASQVRPLCTGGTGSQSDQEVHPAHLPDKFEAGTMNLPGIFGLAAAIRFLREKGIEQIHAWEMARCRQFLDGVAEIDGLRISGPAALDQRVAVVSLDFKALDNAVAADRLDQDYGILTRCGLHCSPAAHRTLGTYPQGSVRFSFGWQTSEADVEAALSALRQLSP